MTASQLSAPVRGNNANLAMSQNINIFSGREAILTTMHGKEAVIAPLMLDKLGMHVTVTTGVDTNAFGTFTGEIERKLSGYETAAAKILTAFDQYPDHTIGIASEGSFGPHPESPFITIDSEIVMLIDRLHGIQLAGHQYSTDTNFDKREISSEVELLEFAERIGFPSHGVILKSKPRNGRPLKFVDIKTQGSLKMAFKYLISTSALKIVDIETDMRAMSNPTRMKNIEAAALDLVAKLLTLCPACGWPGYSVAEVVKGLPCSLCGSATGATLAHIYKCMKCDHTSQISDPYGKISQDPMYCDLCNP